jgi:hypothetical protein
MSKLCNPPHREYNTSCYEQVSVFKCFNSHQSADDITFLINQQQICVFDYSKEVSCYKIDCNIRMQTNYSYLLHQFFDNLTMLYQMQVEVGGQI